MTTTSRPTKHHRGAKAGLAAGLLLLGSATAAQDDLVAQGAYLANAGGCGSCHSEDGQPELSGGAGLESPFGTFYAPNITPDPDTGIGGWSEAQFIRAFREGVSPDGAHYYPAFPYTAYTGMTDADLKALKAYLDSVPPVKRENRDHELVWYASFRLPLMVWKARYLEEGPFQPDANLSDELNRGAYLVRHLGHCAECHTPRDGLGGLDRTQDFAGNPDGPEDDIVPNITPHAEGLPDWSADDIAFYLEIGMEPDGDFVSGSMGEVVENTAKLTGEDREAIGAYIKSLPPLPTAAGADH
jgi:mono/diheme cytochrome c family protein